jgi:hypothetical protein
MLHIEDIKRMSPEVPREISETKTINQVCLQLTCAKISVPKIGHREDHRRRIRVLQTLYMQTSELSRKVGHYNWSEGVATFSL